MTTQPVDDADDEDEDEQSNPGPLPAGEIGDDLADTADEDRATLLGNLEFCEIQIRAAVKGAKEGATLAEISAHLSTASRRILDAQKLCGLQTAWV